VNKTNYPVLDGEYRYLRSCCSKKQNVQFLVITSVNLNRFFTGRFPRKLSLHVQFSTTSRLSLHYLMKLNSSRFLIMPVSLASSHVRSQNSFDLIHGRPVVDLEGASWLCPPPPFGRRTDAVTVLLTSDNCKTCTSEFSK